VRLKRIEHFFLILILIAIILLFLRSIYVKIDEQIQNDSLQKNYQYYRDIDTPHKKWLNGYLGIFFRFKSFGNINWLIIPFFIYLLVTFKKRERWELALAFVYLLTVTLLGIKGYRNWRYQLTLFPFTITIILLTIWEYIKNRSPHTKIVVFSLLGLLITYNFCHYFGSYKYLWNHKADISFKTYPTQVLSYINNMKDTIPEPVFLICDGSNVFFYYSNKRSIPYYSPEYRREFRRKTRAQLYYFLKNELKANYIFSSWRFEADNRNKSIGEILNLDCKQIMSDRGYQLYQIREHLLEEELDSKASTEYKVWDSEAEVNENISSLLKVQGIRGKFSFKYETIKNKKILIVRNKEEGEKGERILQFGYTLDKEIINTYSLRSKYVYFLLTVKIPGNLINKQNYIFIQDFDGTWKRKKMYFSRPGWRSYLISKQIRTQSSEIGVGFSFRPESSENEIAISDVKIYFLDHAI